MHVFTTNLDACQNSMCSCAVWKGWRSQSEVQEVQLAATIVGANSPPATDKNPEELVTGVKQGEERNKKKA